MTVDRRLVAVIAVAALALLPLMGLGAYIQHLLVLWMLFALMAISLNVIIGYLGELSFGHAAFFAIGAYTSAMLSVFAGLPFWLGLIAAPIVAGLLGLVIGYVSLRIKGPQFAILTLGFGAILHSVFVNWVEVTNGPLGITKIPPPRLPFLPGADFGTATPYFYLVLIFVLAAMYLCHALVSSRTGRAFIAIRENDALAASVGIDVFRFKLLGFVIATMMVGRRRQPVRALPAGDHAELFTLHYMAPMVIMVIVGGKGTIAGPAIGALVYVGLLEVLRASGSMRMLVFAMLLTLCIVFLPGGIASLLPASRSRAVRASEPAE